MTNLRKDWDLYVAHFLMKEIKKDDNGNILNESYYINIELFRYDSPEKAYAEIVETAKNDSDSYHDDEGNIIEVCCLGLNNLDKMLCSLEDINNDLKKEKQDYGVQIAIIRQEEFKADENSMLRKKEDMDLFKEQ
jgi:hypothetical protein